MTWIHFFPTPVFELTVLHLRSGLTDDFALISKVNWDFSRTGFSLIILPCFFFGVCLIVLFFDMSAMCFLGVGVGVLDAVDVMMMNDEQYYLLWQVPSEDIWAYRRETLAVH